MRRVAEAKGAGEQKESEALFAEETSRNLQAALTEFEGEVVAVRSLGDAAEDHFEKLRHR